MLYPLSYEGGTGERSAVRLARRNASGDAADPIGHSQTTPSGG